MTVNSTLLFSARITVSKNKNTCWCKIKSQCRHSVSDQYFCKSYRFLVAGLCDGKHTQRRCSVAYTYLPAGLSNQGPSYKIKSWTMLDRHSVANDRSRPQARWQERKHASTLAGGTQTDGLRCGNDQSDVRCLCLCL